MLNIQFTGVFLGLVLGIAGDAFAEKVGTGSITQKLFVWSAFLFFLWRYIYHYYYELRIVESIEMQGKATDGGVKRKSAVEAAVMMSMSLSAVCATQAGRSIDGPWLFFVSLFLSSLFALIGFVTLSRAYPEMIIDERTLKSIRQEWVNWTTVELVVIFIGVGVLSCPESVLREAAQGTVSSRSPRLLELLGWKGLDLQNVADYRLAYGIGIAVILAIILFFEFVLDFAGSREKSTCGVKKAAI